MSTTSEKKGKKAVWMTIGIFLLGMIQSLSTEITANSFIILILGDLIGFWAIIIRISIFLVISLTLNFILELCNKGENTITLVPYNIGGIVALLTFELTTEFFDYLANDSIWAYANSILTIDEVMLHIIAIVFSIIVFVLTGVGIAKLVRGKNNAVGMQSYDVEAKRRYYYISMWSIAYLILVAVGLMILMVLSENMPKWSNYLYSFVL